MTAAKKHCLTDPPLFPLTLMHPLKCALPSLSIGRSAAPSHCLGLGHVASVPPTGARAQEDVDDYYGWEVEAHQVAKPTIDRNAIPDLFDAKNTYFIYVCIKVPPLSPPISV